VDGNDVLAVHAEVTAAVARARAGDGPSLVEARTIRWQGHFEGDAQAYREKAETAEGRRTDPILRLADRLRAAGAWDEAWAKAAEETILAELDAAVAFAEASPDPAPAAALEDLFVDGS
jgi:pyruvate dehydrogenase E1 component alpha subunit